MKDLFRIYLAEEKNKVHDQEGGQEKMNFNIQFRKAELYLGSCVYHSGSIVGLGTKVVLQIKN